ncbi:flagellar hook-associated protein FlgL [Rahnella sp. PD12R]|uniref:flagellar hook-associated protein FlgL n=1 Tax=Rahnella sp. PD12R TaxID=2855688 RepID=UPI001C469228|nr:flagellar hook-associated protein FlgL [Rahnella sp. PD12R]MBV6820086.1 flagellar hook-associated protein FlgL [Rahnella sp. PD12R]
MRITNQVMANTMLQNLNTNGSQMSKLVTQMATQTKIGVPSDDPIASTRLVQMNREQSAINQYQSNISRLSGSLSVQEAHVKAVSDQLQEVQDTLLSAANGVHSQADMEGFGQKVDSMVNNLLATLNARNEDGRYLFAGTKNDQPPVIYDEVSGKYVYQGNEGTRSTTVANGVDIVENTALAQTFGDGSDPLALLNKLNDISKKMQDPASSPESYQDELNALLGDVKTTSDAVSGLFTDLGGRQNRLTLLDDAHTDIKTANEGVIRELSDTDTAQAYVDFNMIYASSQAANKVYAQLSQLSLFNAI